jgi:hypothetical protein
MIGMAVDPEPPDARPSGPEAAARPGVRARRTRSLVRKRRFLRSRVVTAGASLVTTVLLAVTMRFVGPTGTSGASTGSGESGGPVLQGQPLGTPGTSGATPPATGFPQAHLDPHTLTRGS